MATIDQIKTPRMVDPALSPLMQAKGRCRTGEKANACPFGCPDQKLDENGYCKHLVGFTNSTPAECSLGKGLMEPMVTVGGRKVVQVRRESVPGEDGDEEGEPVLEKVLPADVLVRITVSSRVYRQAVEKTKK